MANTATAINNFLSEQEDSFVSPSDAAISQLQDIISNAVQEVIKPLLERIEALEDTLAVQHEEMAAMRLKLAAIESLQEQDINRVTRDICYDRQRITKLEKVEPQPLQKDRAEILRALIAANGGKMLAKDARQKMHLSKELFSMLLASMDKEIETKPLHSDRRNLVLIIK